MIIKKIECCLLQVCLVNNLKVNQIDVLAICFRDHRWKGLSQDINVPDGRVYKVTAYMKLLNVASGHMYEEVETMLACTNSDGLLSLQSTLVISTSLISNNRLSRRENLVPA